MWHSDIAHLLDNHSKTSPIKLLISVVSFDTFHSPFMQVDFDWFLQMKCQLVMDQTNFPVFLLLPGKLGRNSPDKNNVFLCRGEAIHQNAVILLPDRKQTLMLLSACAAFHFAEFVNYLDTHSVCACRVTFMVSTIMSQKSVVFFEVHCNEPFPSVLKFFRFSPRKWNVPCITLNASHLNLWIFQVL